MRRFFLLSLFFVFVFSSCWQEHLGYDSGAVAVRLPDFSSERAIAQDKYTRDAAASYEITVTADGYDETKTGTAGDLLVFDDIPEGSATVSGKALKSDGVTVVAKGSETVSVVADSTVECSLALNLQTFVRPVQSVSIESGSLVFCDGILDSSSDAVITETYEDGSSMSGRLYDFIDYYDIDETPLYVVESGEQVLCIGSINGILVSSKDDPSVNCSVGAASKFTFKEPDAHIERTYDSLNDTFTLTLRTGAEKYYFQNIAGVTDGVGEPYDLSGISWHRDGGQSLGSDLQLGNVLVETNVARYTCKFKIVAASGKFAYCVNPSDVPGTEFSAGLNVSKDSAITVSTFSELKNALTMPVEKIVIAADIEMTEALSTSRSVILEPAGSTATLKRGSTFTGILLTVSNGINVKNIVFDGKKSAVETSDSLLKVTGGTLNLSGCSFLNNGSATKGAVCASGCTGSIDSCTFGGSAENGNNCGAVYATEIGDFTIKNSTISNGTYASGSAGITIAAGKTNTAVVNVENCIIQDNVSSTGGGVCIKNIGSTMATTVNVYGGQLSGNSATSSGGFIHVEDYSSGTQLTVNIGKDGYNTSITGNTSGSNGGGVYVTNTCALNLKYVEISGNTCGSTSNGGGIYTSTKTTVSLGDSVKIINNTKSGSANNAYFGKENVSYNGQTYTKGTAITVDIQ